MNVGCATTDTMDLRCPLCGADIYVYRYGADFRCVNSECDLYEMSPTVLVKKMEDILFRIAKR
jgi:hypothetical protein